MRAGNLRHRVSIQSKAMTSDGMGSWTESWATVATVWAAIWPLSASERVRGNAVEHEISHRVRVRFRPISPADRLLHDGRVLNIKQVINPDERGLMLDLLCMEEST